MKKETKILFSAIAVLGVAGVVFVLAGSSNSIDKKKTDTNKAPVTFVPPVPVADVPKAKTGSTNSNSATNINADIPKATKYKNGTYSVVSSYDSPADVQEMGVSLTLKGDIIVDSTVTAMANEGRSQRYQQAFIGGYKPYVIGKNIDSVNLDVVSGASLTPIGFNDAVAQIKAKALI